MVEYQLLQAPHTEPLLDELHDLVVVALGEIDRAELAWRLAEMPRATVFVARAQQLVAFKIGYAVARTRYHSWLGAVHPAWRRQGIAWQLLQRQHGWLREQGYAAVETATVPANMAMLSLNLRAGFRVMGSYCREGQGQRITLELQLAPAVGA
jgi:GNAT superfamily N-acetyltransferase